MFYFLLYREDVAAGYFWTELQNPHAGFVTIQPHLQTASEIE